MSKIIGESYFYLKRYKDAIPYLQSYRDKIVRISIADKYQLAYAYYMSGDFEIRPNISISSPTASSQWYAQKTNNIV